ncbi:AraC family transcriptional regulator [Burkholderia pseudomallei]|nr:AraC family transcriptional regulator [Burkholderia pseudomallei]
MAKCRGADSRHSRRPVGSVSTIRTSPAGNLNNCHRPAHMAPVTTFDSLHEASGDRLTKCLTKCAMRFAIAMTTAIAMAMAMATAITTATATATANHGIASVRANPRVTPSISACAHGIRRAPSRSSDRGSRQPPATGRPAARRMHASAHRRIGASTHRRMRVRKASHRGLEYHRLECEAGITSERSRRQARRSRTLERPLHGEKPMTNATDHGYPDRSAFAAMRKRQFDAAPSAFRQRPLNVPSTFPQRSIGAPSASGVSPHPRIAPIPPRFHAPRRSSATLASAAAEPGAGKPCDARCPAMATGVIRRRLSPQTNSR